MKFALPILLFVSLCAGCTTEPAPERNPNVIFIIGDDHGYPYYGFMGNEIVSTPNIDRLASESTVFPKAYTSASTCRDSLLTLLTGLHPAQWRAKNRQLERQTGEPRVVFQEIADFETLPKILLRAGYATFQGGKYWEGVYSAGGFSHGMKSQSRQDAIRDFGPVMSAAGGESLEFGRKTLDPLWRFVEEVRHERPFYAWFAPMLPHVPFDAPERHVSRYRDRGFTGTAVRYYANISWFDEVVGELLEYLDTNGLRHNTLLVFLSDNGWEQAPNQNVRIDGGPHGKASIYDYGFRTPLMFSWPGVIDQGIVRDEVVSAVDLFPTTLDFLGLPGPPDRMGISLHPALIDKGAFAREEVIVGATSVRRGTVVDLETSRTV
jgi:uncharacterized sulfatase